MDLIDQLQSLSQNIERQKDKMLTEEATKNAFVMPFIRALGYDVFNPDEVVPEFTADHGIKKGEKVDYAIFMDEKPTILFECKKFGVNLDQKAPSQLYRYYSVTDAKIGIVTDGSKYNFYTDLEEPNKMDDRPYMEIDLLNLDETLIPQLKKLTKSAFDLEMALETATELKYTKAIRRKISELLDNPNRDFVKYFTSLVYDGRFTQNVQEQFTPIVKKAFKQFIREQINDRLETALSEDQEEEVMEEEKSANESEESKESRIETTEEEIEGFHIVKSIVREVVDPDRVHHRDTISYMGILLDDNNRQPICRLHLNGSQWYISLFDEDKNEDKIQIDSLNDIYKYSEKLKTASKSYD
jgi:hypothetical protein